MEVTLTLSRTSPGPGSGTGRCSTRMSSASCRTTAFIIDATTSRETGVYVDEETAVKGLSVPAAPVGRPPDGHATRGALLDLVLYRRDALEILRDRPQIGLGHVLVAGQRPLDVLAHEPAGHVAIGSIARSEVRDDLLLGPLADPGRVVGGDVRRRLTLGPGLLRVARQKARVVHGHGQRGAGSMALTTVPDGSHQILAAPQTRHGRGRRRRFLGGEGGEPDRQEDALEHGHRDLLRRVWTMHRRDRSNERHQGLEVLLGHAIE